MLRVAFFLFGRSRDAYFYIRCAALRMAVLTPAGYANAGRTTEARSIPEVRATAKRTASVDDLATVRTIDSLSVSPDGRR